MRERERKSHELALFFGALNVTRVPHTIGPRTHVSQASQLACWTSGKLVGSYLEPAASSRGSHVKSKIYSVKQSFAV